MIEDQTDMLPREIHARSPTQRLRQRIAERDRIRGRRSLTDEERLANLDRALQEGHEEERREGRFFCGVLVATLLVIPVWWAILWGLARWVLPS